jgi:hypothetical protein
VEAHSQKEQWHHEAKFTTKIDGKTSQKEQRHHEAQFTTKIDGKTSLGPNYFVVQYFHSQLRVWWPIMPKLAVFSPPIRLTLRIITLYNCFIEKLPFVHLLECRHRKKKGRWIWGHSASDHLNSYMIRCRIVHDVILKGWFACVHLTLFTIFEKKIAHFEIIKQPKIDHSR